MRSRFGRIALPSRACVLMLLMGAAARGQQISSVPTGPLCGLYSLYTALKAERVPTRFDDLLKPQYLGSASGSTLLELATAARDHHAHAELLENLSVQDLRHLRCPLILHVKSEYDSPDYNHFVLCVPLADGRLGLYDPPDPLVRTAGNELAPVWDGTALAVSRTPIDLMPMRLWAGGRLAAIVVLVLTMAGGIRWAQAKLQQRYWFHRWHSPALQCPVLCIVSSIAAASYHVYAAQGFAFQAEAVNAIRNAHFEQPSASLNWARAWRTWQDKTALFIDARIPEDYRQGHVEAAINLPPNATRADRALALANVPKSTPIVVYCLNPSCPYAALLAKRLARDGFANVQVFSGGWSDWTSHTHPSGAHPPGAMGTKP